MPSTSPRLGVLALLAVLLLPDSLHAQYRAPGVYALTNARIVPVSGLVIARGSIVNHNGLIAAVGANVAVPADARQIDGAALWVYPGRIDARACSAKWSRRTRSSCSTGSAIARAPTSRPQPQPAADRLPT